MHKYLHSIAKVRIFTLMKQTNNIMKIQNGSKAVKISYNEFNGFIANYIQVYKGEEQVLETKSFAIKQNAIRWANKQLS